VNPKKSFKSHNTSYVKVISTNFKIYQSKIISSFCLMIIVIIFADMHHKTFCNTLISVYVVPIEQFSNNFMDGDPCKLTLTSWQIKFNQIISKTRYKVERTADSMKRWFKAGVDRYTGLAKKRISSA
jgi:hypothetical protein